METGIARATPGFRVEGRYADGVTALRASGRLVAGVGAGDTAWQSARDWRGARRIVVDLGAVTAIDAGGVGALLRLRQSAQRHGAAVTIAAASARVRRVLQLTRLDGVFGLVPATPSDPLGLLGGLLCRCA
jgi:anti-anti-sigma factor